MFQMDNHEFSEWLRKELDDRDMEVTELATKMSVPPASIYRILNGERDAGDEICRGIAKALGLPQDTVFYRAGLLTEKPEYGDDISELATLFDSLSEDDKDEMIQLARMKSDKNKKTRK
jgi:transcriptional regulator with XRE-family HTH domain